MEVQEGYESVENWLSRLQPSTVRSKRHYFKKWYEWLQENSPKFEGLKPDELIECQKGSPNGSQYDIVDQIQKWILSLHGRVSTKKNAYSSIRSFFVHNRAQLPNDPAFNIRGDEPKVQGTLTVEDIKKVVMSSNPMYQAAFLCMFQSGMGQDEFVWWSNNGWKKLKEDLDAELQVVRVDLPGRKMMKNEKPYYTFIGSDSVDALRNWLKHRPANAETILTDQFGKPLSKTGLNIYWRRHLRKLGLVELKKGWSASYRTGKNLHEMRDVFRSQWSKSPAKYEVGEFFMGHTVDPYEYDKSFRDVAFYQKEYLSALPMFQIISSGSPFGRVNLNEVEGLQTRIRELETELGKRDNALTRVEESLQQVMERLNKLEKSPL